MSRGQLPRWPAFYPRMKVRGKGRPRGPRITVWDSRMRPVWPPVLRVGDTGLTVHIDAAGVRLTGKSAAGSRMSYWTEFPHA